jgi:hypothetical protein
MKLFVDDIVKLSGVSRHGKNRIRENGELWKVMTVDGQDSSILTTKVCVAPLDTERSENWRWVDIPNDEHMEISLHRREEPEHVVDERKVDEAIERMRDRAQMDMFNDETMNWSGLR